MVLDLEKEIKKFQHHSIKGIGTDIENQDRIQYLLNNYSAEELEFVFTKKEIEKNYDSKKLLTVCFSAKESVFKSSNALVKQFAWSDIEIDIQKNGRFIPTWKRNRDKWIGLWDLYDNNHIVTFAIRW